MFDSAAIERSTTLWTRCAPAGL